MIAKLKDVLRRAEAWPEQAQAELAEIALEIEAVLSSDHYKASPDELRAIDKAEHSETATNAEVEAAFATFRRA